VREMSVTGQSYKAIRFKGFCIPPLHAVRDSGLCRLGA